MAIGPSDNQPFDCTTLVLEVLTVQDNEIAEVGTINVFIYDAVLGHIRTYHLPDNEWMRCVLCHSCGLTICYLEVVKIMLHEILQIITKVDLELILEPVGLSLGNVTDGVGFEYRGCRFSDNPFSSVVPRHNPHRQREKSVSEKENYMVKNGFMICVVILTGEVCRQFSVLIYWPVWSSSRRGLIV